MTSLQDTLLADLAPDGTPSKGTRAYLAVRTQGEWYDFVVKKFLAEESAGRLTRAELARRTGKSPAVISRLLGRPANWTLETLSSLLAGVSTEETVPMSRPILRNSDSNQSLPDWASRLNGRMENEPPPPPNGLGTPQPRNDTNLLVGV